MRSRIAGALGWIALVAAALPAHAFDGRRSGFLMGFGVGPVLTTGYARTLTRADGSEIWSKDAGSDFGLVTDFRIGAGIGDRFLLYYLGRVSVFTFDLGYDAAFLNTMSRVAASYYFRDGSPSFYVLGNVGVSSWTVFFEGDWDTPAGLGAGAGVGWEFSRHWSLEAAVNWGESTDDEVPPPGWFSHDPSNLNVETAAWSFLITFNGLVY
jgi:hypothetical protein